MRYLINGAVIFFRSLNFSASIMFSIPPIIRAIPEITIMPAAPAASSSA